MHFIQYGAQDPMPAAVFQEFEQLICAAFPPEERRSMAEFRALQADPRFFILTAAEESGSMLGALFLWLLPDFLFLENFAVMPALRNQGIGGKMLTELLSRFPGTHILEVEPPEDSLTRRRVGFYERNGFHLSEHEYYLPCLHEEILHSVRLQLMSRPQPLSEEAAAQITDQLYRTVYHGKPVRR